MTTRDRLASLAAWGLVLALALIAFAGAALMGPDGGVLAQPWIGR